MANSRVHIGTEGPLSPGEVARRGFSVVRRGFDPNEVRPFLEAIASELRRLQERIDELERQAAAPPAPPPSPSMDVATLTSALGDEMARVLRTAQEAALDLKARAEDGAARTLNEAHEEAARLRSAAESLLAERTEEAEAMAAKIRAEVEAEIEAKRQTARTEADEAVQAAIARGREMVGEAQAARERMLSDLARRRKAALAQIEQLRAGRARLLEAYRVVRSSLDDITGELERADTEARTVMVAPPRALGEGTALEAPAADAPPPAEAAPPPEVAASPVAEVATSPVEVAAPPPEVAASPVAEVATSPVAEVAAAAEVAGSPGPSPGPEAAQPDGDGMEPERPAPRPPLPPPPVAAPAAELPPEAVGPAAAAAATPPPPSAPGVHELFARLRATEPQGPAEVSAEPSAPPVDVVITVEVDEEADELWRQRRDEILEPLTASLVRKLKRVLQDEQNDLLQRLRVHRGPLTAAAVLPPAESHGEPYTRVAAEALLEVEDAGATLGGRIAERDVAGAADREALGAVVADLTAAVVEPLRQHLHRALTAEAGDDGDGIPAADVVSAAYREWKSGRLERVVGDHVTAALTLGMRRAVPVGTPVRWVVEDVDGPCPDCDDNALAGAIALGEAFPTGQVGPPAHPGCRCLLAPVSA